MREKKGLFGLIFVNILIIALAIVVFASPYVVRADDGENTARKTEAQWYELNEDDKILTVRLEDTASSSYEWRFGLSNDSLYNLYPHDVDEEDVVKYTKSTPEEWVVSFRAKDGFSGDSVVKFSYQNGRNAAVNSKVLKIHVAEDSSITVLED